MRSEASPISKYTVMTYLSIRKVMRPTWQLLVHCWGDCNTTVWKLHPNMQINVLQCGFSGLSHLQRWYSTWGRYFENTERDEVSLWCKSSVPIPRLVNFFHRFIPNYSLSAFRLSSLFRKNSRWNGKEEMPDTAKSGFDYLKKLFWSAPHWIIPWIRNLSTCLLTLPKEQKKSWAW